MPIENCRFKELRFRIYGDEEGKKLKQYWIINNTDIASKAKFQAIQEATKSHFLICHKDMPVEIDIKYFRMMPKTTLPIWKKKAMRAGVIPPLIQGEENQKIVTTILEALEKVLYESVSQVYKTSYEVGSADEPYIEVSLRGYYLNVGQIKENTKRKVVGR